MTPVPIECVARGYLAGSGWKEYRGPGAVCGIALPPGLREADRLPEPIFTPATKAQSGHDENISSATAASLIGLTPTFRDAHAGLYASPRARRGARHHPRRHQVRIRVDRPTATSA